MAIAPITRYIVPTIAGKIPPDLPASLGDWVRKSHESAGRPWTMMSWRMMTRIARTMRVAPVISAKEHFWIVACESRFLPKYHAPPASRTRAASHQDAAANRTIKRIAAKRIFESSRSSPLQRADHGFPAGTGRAPFVKVAEDGDRRRLMTSVMSSSTTATANSAW